MTKQGHLPNRSSIGASSESPVALIAIFMSWLPSSVIILGVGEYRARPSLTMQRPCQGRMVIRNRVRSGGNGPLQRNPRRADGTGNADCSLGNPERVAICTVVAPRTQTPGELQMVFSWSKKDYAPLP